MLRWLLRRTIESFERKWNYDASYLKEIVDLSPLAALKFSLATSLGSYRRDVPPDALFAAGITAVRSEDCGPCTQLVIAMAEQQGVRPEILRALLKDDVAAMPEEVALAWRFTRATLAHDRSGRRLPRRDRQTLGAARRGDAGVCDHDGAHVSDGEVRDGPRQDLLARGRQRRTGGDRSRRGDHAIASDLGAVAREPSLMIDPALSFEPHRRRLRGLAYRMLGSIAEAEDAVQDAYLRWHALDRDQVTDPRAFLTTATTRICLDVLRSARARHEEYVGPWLPEPVVDTNALAPDAQTELAEDLSIALLLALDRLSPLERAAFLLHDVFDCSFSEVASALDRSEAACRQLASRARTHVREARPRDESVARDRADDDDHETRGARIGVRRCGAFRRSRRLDEYAGRGRTSGD